MKRYVALAILAPGSVFAHGGHAPVPDVAHGVSHMLPYLGVGLLVLFGGLALRQLIRS